MRRADKRRRYTGWLYIAVGVICWLPSQLSAAQFMKRIFPYSDDSVYEIICQPFKVVDIRLEPGEKLRALTAGDTERWKIGQAEATDAAGIPRTHVMAKPIMPDITTNMVIITDRRTYTVDLRSLQPGSTKFDPVVEWSYGGSADFILIAPPPVPQQQRPPDITPKQVEDIVDEKLAEVPGSPLSSVKNLTPTDSSSNTNASLNFDYKIKANGKYDWLPTQVFDDGLKTYILMPLSIRATEAPVLFMLVDKRRVLVNYRVRGRWYIIDRIMDHAELLIRDHNLEQKVEIIRHPEPAIWKKLLPFV